MFANFGDNFEIYPKLCTVYCVNPVIAESGTHFVVQIVRKTRVNKLVDT